MKQYFKTLWFAIIGENPFSLELEEVKQQYEKTAQHVESLQDMYFKSLEKWEQAEKMLEEAHKQVEDEKKEVNSLQQFVETLRKRIADYQKRIDEYNQMIDELRGK